MGKTFVIGTNIYRAEGEASIRMKNAFETWRRLGAPLVDIAFEDTPPFDEPGFEELRCLSRDSRTITNHDGLRKPLVSDLFDGLCEAAKKRGCEYFVFANSDIQLTSQFHEAVASTELDSLIFTRLDFDFDPTDPSAKLFLRGQDVFAIRVAWWSRNRGLFQPYILGEPLWDNIYTAKLARNGRSSLVYSRNMCHHKRHDQHWNPASVFGKYNEKLRLRSDYLDYGMWSKYIDELLAITLEAGTACAEDQEMLWRRLSGDKPSTWLQIKRLAAVPLSFVMDMPLSSKTS